MENKTRTKAEQEYQDFCMKRLGEPFGIDTSIKPQHTPTPWKVWIERDMDAPGFKRIKLVDADQFIVAELIISKESQLDDVEKEADRIVHAVNNHENLIHTLSNALDQLRYLNANEFIIKQCEEATDKAYGKTYQQRVTDAITQAEGGK